MQVSAPNRVLHLLCPEKSSSTPVLIYHGFSGGFIIILQSSLGLVFNFSSLDPLSVLWRFSTYLYQPFLSNSSLFFIYSYLVSFLLLSISCFVENKSGFEKSIIENYGPVRSFIPFTSFWFTSSRNTCVRVECVLEANKQLEIETQISIASCFPEFLNFPVALFSPQHCLFSIESSLNYLT